MTMAAIPAVRWSDPDCRSCSPTSQSGLIDVVVVYKVDRLTRSLTDFARIVEAFDARNASFVSVTQSFNTTTSMGRLTLNVLLSFAQFEREVTGERIRDKIAASKKKGMWMGGFVPMGYAANGRSLTIVESEAAVIRRIFDRFLALESVRDLKAELDRDGITTRPFVSASNNRSWGNRPFSIGHLRSILQNPIYIGEVRHKDERYPAQHPAIIDREQFDRVQALISSRARKHRMRIGAEHINLLSGLLFDQHGQKFTSAHSSKQGIRYRYYVSIDRSSPSASPQRIPAGDIERLVRRKHHRKAERHPLAASQRCDRRRHPGYDREKRWLSQTTSPGISPARQSDCPPAPSRDCQPYRHLTRQRSPFS